MAALRVLLIVLLQFAYGAGDEFRFVLGQQNENEIWKRAEVQRLPLWPDTRAEVLRFEQPLRELLTKIQSEKGEIACDCGLYVQIQAQLERGDERPAVMLSPGGNSAEIIACACGRDFAYLRPDDLLAFQILQNSSWLNKGHWLVPMQGPRHELLGLLRDGPALGTAEQWKRWAAEGLKSEFLNCQPNLEPGSRRWEETEFLRVLYKSNALGEWTLTPVRQSNLSSPRRQAVRRLLRSLRE